MFINSLSESLYASFGVRKHKQDCQVMNETGKSPVCRAGESPIADRKDRQVQEILEIIGWLGLKRT